MPKTLYISDLDGTLLTPQITLSEATKTALRELTAQGLWFGVATARTWEVCRHILREVLPLPAPLVLLNGALVYDSQAGRYLKAALLPPEDVAALLRLVKAQGQTGFLYSFQQEHIIPYHEPITRPTLAAFKQARLDRYLRFVETDDLCAQATKENILYFTTQDTRERLLPLYEAVRAVPTLDCAMYADDYIPGNWYLECFSCQASKGNAVRYLRKTLAPREIVAFGDNLNDLSLFAACDKGYATANAREELKAAAAGIVGANTEDGVARFLRDHWKP